MIHTWQLGKPSLKKNILLLTFINKDFTPPPPNYWQKTIEVGGPVRGVTPPFIEVKKTLSKNTLGNFKVF